MTHGPVCIFGQDLAEPKRYFAGTHRTRSPAETVLDYARFMPAMGITRLANITGLDCIGLPVYLAIRPNSRALSGSQGKGFDAASAKASALMESIETWHAERIEAALRHDSHRSLRKRAAVVDIEQLALRKGKVVRHDVPMLWIEGWDLMTAQPMFVPFAAVTTNFVPNADLDCAFVSSSNGLASGNHLLEALVHALCEVIERDACALAMAASEDERRAIRVDLATVDHALAAQALSLVRDAGVEIVVHDTTSDTGIPTYECKIFDPPEVPRWSLRGFTGGFGCHLCPGVAMMRAVTEAIQSRLTLIAGSRDDNFLSTYESAADPALLRAQAEKLRREAAPLRFRTESLATETFHEDVHVLLDALRRIGIRHAVAVDLSRSDVGIPVVKVVVPGLEGHHKGEQYRPGARAIAKGQKVQS